MFSIEKASYRKERQDLFVCFSNQGALPASSFLNWTGHAAAAASGNNSVGLAIGGQFGTGTNLAPLPIWHRSQFGTGPIWHQEYKRVNLTPESIWHQEC